jgi:hypothetical protein
MFTAVKQRITEKQDGKKEQKGEAMKIKTNWRVRESVTTAAVDGVLRQLEGLNVAEASSVLSRASDRLNEQIDEVMVTDLLPLHSCHQAPLQEFEEWWRNIRLLISSRDRFDTSQESVLSNQQQGAADLHRTHPVA